MIKPMPISNLPMIVTWIRILITPLVAGLMLLEVNNWHIWASGLFVLASITDWLDGYLARKLNAVTLWGKFLDPIADKVLVSTVLILLVPLGRLDAVAVILLLNRDILIGGVRSVAATYGLVISAGPLGKWKTALQMIAIPLLLFGGAPFGINIVEIGYWGIWISVALSVISGLQYFLAFQKLVPTIPEGNS